VQPLLYEINTRCWLRELSTRHGTELTLANVPQAEFAHWQRLGFTHIWLMGVWTSGPRSRAVALAVEDLKSSHLADPEGTAIAGSPYAIAEYKVPVALGGEAGLQAFRRKLHEHDMKLILDFVPNHVGLDHPWLSGRPELFVQSVGKTPGTFAQETRDGLRWLAHGRDPYFSPWTDTAQLDYRSPATRAAMQNALLSIADRCDGVRCDMAMLILNDVFAKTWAKFPVVDTSSSRCEEAHSKIRSEVSLLTSAATSSEFWPDAIAATKQAHPDFLFLAEVYWDLEARLQTLGFDYTYDKKLYDDLVRHNPRGVQERLLQADPRFLAASVHFLENHDEPRIASLLAPAEHRAAALLILALPGMRLLHEGQLTGARVKIPVQFCRRPAEDSQPAIEQFYEQLFTVLPRTAIGRGKSSILKPREAWPGNPTAQNIILIQWQSNPAEFDLVAINLAPHRSQCYAPITADLQGNQQWRMRDLLGSEQYERAGSELQTRGAFLDLPEHAAQLFHFNTLT
jgi:glycosidase